MVAAFNQSNSFSMLSSSIQESFQTIDRFEMQASEELREMRDRRVFLEGGYTSFEQYCEQELSKWGGYRRVNQLLGAQLVIDALKDTEFDGVIKRESHARPLLKLVKQPEKLKQAVAIACQDNPTPVATDFRAAVQKVEPSPKKNKSQEQLFLRGAKVRVVCKNHARYGDEGVIAAEAPNNWQQIVEFDDGERVAIRNGELDAASSPYPQERTYPKEYSEAIAQLKQQHEQELKLVEQEARIKAETQAEANAVRKVAEQLEVQRAIAQSKSQEVTKLQQEVDRLCSLQRLEEENKRLRQEIENLKTQLQEQANKEWQHPLNKDATKLLSAEVRTIVENLEPELHLRTLASKAPSNCEECLRLMAIALGVLGDAMNNTQALEAAAMLLGVGAGLSKSSLVTEDICEPARTVVSGQLSVVSNESVVGGQSAVAPPSPHLLISSSPSPPLSSIDEALGRIRSMLTPDCTWDEFWEVAQGYQNIKKEYWRSLTAQEQAFITKLKKKQDFKEKYNLYPGLWVGGSDTCSTLYNCKGVVESVNADTEQVFVWWRLVPENGHIYKERNHYEPKDLRVIQTPEEFVEF